MNIFLKLSISILLSNILIAISLYLNLYYLILLSIILIAYGLYLISILSDEIINLRDSFSYAKEKKAQKLKLHSFSINEIKDIVVILNDILKLHKNSVKNKEYVKTVEKQTSFYKETAELDNLTKLYNRFKFGEESTKAIRRAQVTGEALSIIMFDIDHFKKVNDTHGHDIGDIIIKAFADLARKCLKKSDIVARWGGEEFVILLANINLEEARVIAERIRVTIDEYDFPVIGHKTGSFGVSTLIHDEDVSVETIIKRSDEALYISKESGRNQVNIK